MQKMHICINLPLLVKISGGLFSFYFLVELVSISCMLNPFTITLLMNLSEKPTY